MDVALSPPQMEFYTSKAKSVAAVAGFGSGKTDIALYRLFSTMVQNPHANMLYLAPTFPLIRDIWYPKVESLMDTLGIKFQINKGENTIKINGLGKIFCRTMEHPYRIIGFEVLDAFLDELDVYATEKALEIWRKAKARCRMKGNKPNQMFVTTTPEGFRATYQLFKRDPLPNSHLIQMSTYSNEANLPDDYIQDLKDNYPAELIDAYIMGIFTNLQSGRVWKSYDRVENRADDYYQEGEPLTIGMDFNVQRGCAVIYGKRRKGLVAIDEIVGSYDTPDTIRVLKERYPENQITVIPDASGESRRSVNATTSDIALLRREKFRILKNDANPNIKDRIQATNAMFLNGQGERRLWVNDDRCPNYAEALENQIYDKNGLPQKGDGKYDDLTDAGTYPIAKLFPIKQRSTRVKKVVGL